MPDRVTRSLPEDARGLVFFEVDREVSRGAVSTGSVASPGEAPDVWSCQSPGRARRVAEVEVALGDMASMTADASELIGRMVRGDRSGLEGLYDRYGQLVFNLVSRVVGNRADAEEVLQEVFLQAWRSAARYDPSRGSPEAWLIMMARSRAIDAVRAARRSPTRLEAEPVADVPASMPDLAGTVEARALVTAALADLTEAQREVLELAFYDGLSQAEIAARTGAPLGTVKTRTRMALDRLRRTFAMKGWSR
jgi:RNA polymerase sigma-70 factor (ECF subfamily)